MSSSCDGPGLCQRSLDPLGASRLPPEGERAPWERPGGAPVARHRGSTIAIPIALMGTHAKPRIISRIRVALLACFIALQHSVTAPVEPMSGAAATTSPYNPETQGFPSGVADSDARSSLTLQRPDD